MKIDRYKLALEITRKYYNHAKEAGDYIAVARYENIFPELRESEDERIRKELVNFILYKAGRVLLDKETEHRFVAYLEKQKDIHFDYPGLYFYDGEKLHFQGNPALEDNPYDFAMSQQEKQKEQKPSNVDYISGIRKELLEIEDNVKNIDGLTESQWVAIRAAHRLLDEYAEQEQIPLL